MTALLALALLAAQGPAAGATPTTTSSTSASGAAPAAVEPAPSAAQAVSGPPATTAAPIYTVPLAHTAGVMIGMRIALSLLWPDAYDPRPLGRSGEQYKLAWTRPPEYQSMRGLLESDGDPWTINVFGHGLFGAEIYGRVRSCHGSPLAAVAFTAGTSVAWEYGLEAFHKRPSGVDLVMTPLLGAALGEGRYQLQRWLRAGPRTAWRRALEIIIDPLGEGERGLLHTRC